MRAYVTLAAMYQYNPDVFADLQVPQGMDKQILIDSILAECADLEILYPNPQTLQALISIWAKREFEVWVKLYETENYDYDPIYNYDRHFTVTEDTQRIDNETRNLQESATDSRTGKDSRVVKEAGSQNDTDEHTSDTTGKTVNSGEDVRTVQKAAFNKIAPDALPTDSVETDKAGTAAETTGKITAKDTHASRTGKDTTDTVDRTESGENTVKNTGTVDRDEHTMHTHTERGYGNIGVTTTQQMIAEQRETVQFCTYDYIVSEFRRKFCILIY